MAYSDDDLKPYKATIMVGDKPHEFTGHAPTRGAARKHIRIVMAQHAEKNEGLEVKHTGFVFDNKDAPIEEEKPSADKATEGGEHAV